MSWHKRRILARLNPKVNKGQKIEILQLATFNKKSLLHIKIIHKHGESVSYHMRKYPVQEHHRIVRALRYLIDEDKIKSNMITKEWDIQLALGVAEVRKFTLKEDNIDGVK